ncbi:hypothetical protein BDB01DRAFT_835315 [Pilobolus umbonatus]|nr:hypothetical protein BDB01DRAFT_835315 [Pilobolus umbonatus]
MHITVGAHYPFSGFNCGGRMESVLIGNTWNQCGDYVKVDPVTTRTLQAELSREANTLNKLYTVLTVSIFLFYLIFQTRAILGFYTYCSGIKCDDGVISLLYPSSSPYVHSKEYQESPSHQYFSFDGFSPGWPIPHYVFSITCKKIDERGI